MKIRPAIVIILLSSSMLRTASAQAPRTEIMKWPLGAKAAVSLTFDDGSPNQFRVAVPILDRLGLPATFHIITGEVAGSKYPATFVGRPSDEIVRETADRPTDRGNLFERASAIAHLGFAEGKDYQDRAGELYEEGKIEAACRTIDEAYAKVRRGELKKKAGAEDHAAGDDGLTWDLLKGLAGRGHEISSHSVSHARLAVLDDANLAYELDKSRQDILEHLGPKHTFTVECPYGTEDERVMRFALARYPASRNRMPEPFLEEINRWGRADPAASTKEYVQWQRGVLTATPMAEMKGWVDTAAGRDNVWLVLVFHGVDGVGWEPKTGVELADYFGYLKAKGDAVWVATFQDAAKYLRERMHGRVQASWDGPLIKVGLSHDLTDPRYDLPLTLKTYVPGNWGAVVMTQAGRTARLRPASDPGGSFVVYTALANGAAVVLAKAD